MTKPICLYPISKIAHACGVSINALRFYETKGLLKPAYTAPDSGYRYYSRENLHRLRTIIRLKKAGLSLQEITTYLDGKMNVQTRIKELEEKKVLIDNAIEDLKIRATARGKTEISDIILPERLCLCHAFCAKNGEQAIAEISDFYHKIIMSGVAMDKRWSEFCEYPNDELLTGNFENTNFLITACVPIEEKGAPAKAVRYPAMHGVVCNFRGSYYDLWQAYAALHEYIATHNYEVAGHAQEIYMEIDAGGAVGITDENNITRVIIPVNSANKEDRSADEN